MAKNAIEAAPSSIKDLTNTSWIKWFAKIGEILSGKRPLQWTDATLNANWSNTGGAFANVGYAMTWDGMICLRGRITAGAGAANPVFTLPPGFRPLNTVVFSVRGNVGYSTVSILSSGSVSVSNTTSTDTTQFDGVLFYREQ